MARIFQSGFESLGSVSGDWTLGASGAVASPVRSGSYAARVFPNSATSNYPSPALATPVASAYVRAYFYFPSDQTYDSTMDSGQRMLSLLPTPESNTPICTILMRQNGTALEFQAYNYVASANVGSVVSLPQEYARNRWIRFEMYCVVSATVGVITMRIDGENERTASSLNTGTANIERISLQNGNSGTSDSASYYADDVALNDTTGTRNNSWPGEGRIVNYYPGSDVISNWSVTGAASHYDAVDDWDNATYVVTTSKTANLTDQWGFAPLNDSLMPWGSIINAALFGFRGLGTAAQSRTVNFRIDDNCGYSRESGSIELGSGNTWWTFFPAFASLDIGLNGHMTFQNSGVSTWQPIYGDGGTNEAAAQMFKIPSWYYGAGVHVWLRKTGNPLDNLRFEIRYDALDGKKIDGIDVPPGSVGAGGGSVNLYNNNSHRVHENRTAYLILYRLGSRDTSNYYEVGVSTGNVIADQTPYVKASGSWASGTNDWCWLWYGYISKFYLNAIKARVVDLDTTTREMRITTVWGSVDFTPQIGDLPPASLLLMRPRIMKRRKIRP